MIPHRCTFVVADGMSQVWQLLVLNELLREARYCPVRFRF
jgi:hypothetical protein